MLTLSPRTSNLHVETTRSKVFFSNRSICLCVVMLRQMRPQYCGPYWITKFKFVCIIKLLRQWSRSWCGLLQIIHRLLGGNGYPLSPSPSGHLLTSCDTHLRVHLRPFNFGIFDIMRARTKITDLCGLIGTESLHLKNLLSNGLCNTVRSLKNSIEVLDISEPKWAVWDWINMNQFFYSIHPVFRFACYMWWSWIIFILYYVYLYI